MSKALFIAAITIVYSLCMGSAADAAESKKYSPPRTFDGKPDLQGVWTNSSVTQLERPAGIASLVLTPEQAAQMVNKDARANRVKTDVAPTDPKTGLLDGSDLAGGRGYNSFWIDPGVQIGQVKGEYRSSWIVEPANGKLPYSDAARKRIAVAEREEENFDGPEPRPLGERCLATTGRTGPPMVNGLYNNHYQIVQTQSTVIILSEMIQHARIVRMNAKHLPPHMTSLFGDSIGHWEGDTLVVETTNFNSLRAKHAHPAYLSSNAKVIERFTRYSPRQIFYEYSVTDPEFYTQTWRGESSLNTADEPIYEYACHEGNYAMLGILSGAREQEKARKSKR